MIRSTFYAIQIGPPKSPEKGDMFLEGKAMEEQKLEKQIGDGISYYVFINNKEYTVGYDILEEG